MTSPDSSRASNPFARRLGVALVGLFVLLSLACQDDEERIASFVERGEKYVAEGKDEEAIIEYKNVLQRDPENAKAHEALSLAYLRVDKPREAYWEMSETVRVDPNNLEARLRYGTISAAIGDYDTSLEQADAVLAQEPDNPRGHTLRAQARENREDYEGAEADYKAAVASDPNAAAFHFLLGGFYERRGEFEKAEAAYERLLEAEESYLGAAALGRVVLRDRKRKQEGDAILERMIRLAHAAPLEKFSSETQDENTGTTSLKHNVLRPAAVEGAYTLKAMVQYERGDTEGALATLEKGISTGDATVPLIYQKANLYRLQGRSEDERAMIRRATEEAPDNAAAQLVLSAYLGQRGDVDGALEAARAAVAADPKNRAAQLREAELLVDLGFRDGQSDSIQAGRGIVDEVLEAEPDSPEAHFVKAKIELAEGDLAAAKSSLETTLQARPNWGQARFVLGSTLAAAGDLARARVELESAVENEPKLTDARKLLTQIYAQLGEFEFAIEEGRTYLRDRPNDSEIRIVVGQSLIRVGRAEEAYQEIAAIPDDQRDAPALFALGRLDLAYGRVEEGAAKMRRAEQLAPGNPQVIRSLLAIDRSRKELPASVARIERALEANPEDSELVELDAEVKLLSGDLPAAIAALEKAVSLEPRNVTAQLALADLANREGDLPRVVEIIERAAAALPESSDLQFRLAQAYERNGRSDDAMVAYERAISQNGDLAMAKNNLAYMLAESGRDLDRALELAQQAKEQLPDDGNSADTLGWVLLKRGLPSAAIGYLREATGQFPKDAFEIQGIVHNHLAEAYEQNRELDKALSISRETLSLYDQLVAAAKSQGVEVAETDWAKEARGRIERLESQS